MPFMLMTHEKDPKDDLLDRIGDLKGFELFNNQVLCAIYVRPERTKSGLLLPDATRDEDKSQSKVGLVIKKGATAFIDPDGKWFNGASCDECDWIYYRASDGWAININGVPCRILDDINVRGRIPHPDMVW